MKTLEPSRGQSCCPPRRLLSFFKSSKLIQLSLLLFCLVGNINFSNGQDAEIPGAELSVQPSKLQFGLNAGYDLMPSYSPSFTYLGINGGLKFGATLDYNFSQFGIGLDYDYFNNKSKSTIANTFYSDSTLVNSLTKTDQAQVITRHFIGIGPNFNYGIGEAINLKLYARGGYAIIKGGELMTTASNGSGSIDNHVLFSGIDSKGLAAKGGLNFDFKISNNLAASLGAYYMRHMSVHTDGVFDATNQGNIGIIYGHSPFIDVQSDMAIGNGNAFVVESPGPEEVDPCAAYSSIGLQVGFKYLFSASPKKEKICDNCGCPDDGHKVIVTVKDEISGKIIPNTDVAIKDMDGNIIATGTSNTYGVVDFGEIPHGNYYVTGKVYGVETESTSITEEEFLPDAIIRKEVLYTDMRFLLKGKVVNKKTRAGESNVVVNLTHKGNRNVLQESSGGQGEFGFPLEKNSSYEIVGVKENKLSDIKTASTVGLRRSTTLFVDLELGVENFDCGQGTVLDIKYEYDKATLLPESIFELERLVRYMKDHNVSKIELSSHTDSRGSNSYNQDLSQRRAESAVKYITSKGINRSRISANGYGETKLLNRCSDGVNCNEEEHRLNRRTEAKLLCN